MVYLFAQKSFIAKQEARRGPMYVFYIVYGETLAIVREVVIKHIKWVRRLRYIGNKSGILESQNQINENEVADEKL